MDSGRFVATSTSFLNSTDSSPVVVPGNTLCGNQHEMKLHNLRRHATHANKLALTGLPRINVLWYWVTVESILTLSCYAEVCLDICFLWNYYAKNQI